MSKKRSKISEHITEHPTAWAAIFVVMWAAVTNGMFALTNYVIQNAFMLFLCFMLLYPIMLLVICFIYAKRCGIVWYLHFAIIAIVVAEFALFEDFRAIQPNMIVTTCFALVFGSGIGNVFADKELIDRVKKEKLGKRLHEDKPYTKILDDKKKER